MNTQENQPDNTHDWHDVLLDRGLAEIVGGETPPDLSEKILAAASADNHQPSVNLADAPRALPISKRKHWVMFTAAACLFLSLGTWLLVSEPRYRHAEKTLAEVDQREAANNSKQIELDAAAARFVRKTEDPMMAVAPRIIIQEEEEERLSISNEEQASEPLAPSATDPAQADEYLKDVIRYKGTSQLRTRSESVSKAKTSSESFGDGFVPATPAVEAELQLAPNDLLQSQLAKNLLHRSAQGRGEQTRELEDLSVPSRQNSFATDADGPPIVFPDSAEWDKLSARRKKYAPVDLDGKRPELETLSEHRPEGAGDALELGDTPRGHSQRFRIDANPGGNVDASGPQADNFFADLRFEPRSVLNSSASRDQYTPIHENPFVKALGPDAVSTFSIDVDTASYANVRQFLTQSRQLPPPDAVRIEELINYFDYDYTGPTDDTPFAAHIEVATCPWNNEHRLTRIAIKGKEIDREQRPQSNLVFLIDVSGSMNEPNKLPLLVEGMKLLTRELGENDKVAIVVYASTEGVVLESTRGDQQETILAALNRLQAGGSTAGGAGINRAYQIALDNFIEGATNRVILCTDGDFNVGVTSTDDLTRLAEEKAKTGVFLTVLGFGRGNLNDAMMESIANHGNGNYHYVDSLTEARKVLVEQMTGTLITIAKDVKIQIEFNPAKVAGYRLIGYENRMLATEDFNDDKKDAGEIGAGHTVTALYEIVPAGKEVGSSAADPLKYQKSEANFSSMDGKHGFGARVEGTGERGGEGPPNDDGFAIKQPQSRSAVSDELLTLKLRYKLPDADKSTKLEFPITDKGESFAESTKDFQFATAVASFGMLLRHSQYQGETSFDAVSEIAQAALGNDPRNYRAEFLDLVRLAKQLTSEQPSSTADPSTTEGP